MAKFLVPVDGSQNANRAVSHAIEMSKAMPEMQLVVLNVQEHLERGYVHGLVYRFLIVFGRPAEVITRVANEQDCSGIIMGTRGLGDLQSVFLGSTSYKVVHLADIPVTLVKQGLRRDGQMRLVASDSLRAAMWLGLYLAAVAAPLFALLPGQVSAGRGFRWDFDGEKGRERRRHEFHHPLSGPARHPAPARDVAGREMTAGGSTMVHVLVAVDGSAHSLAAVRWIAGLAAARARLRFTLVDVQKPVMSGEVGAIAPADIALERRERRASEVLDQASAILWPAGVRYDAEEQVDDAATAIVARCDAVVVGRRGVGALRAALLGSVSAEVIRRSGVPVIVVSPTSGESAAVAPNCLVAVHGSESAGRAAAFASRLSVAAGSELHLLHVARPYSVAGVIFGTRENMVERLSGRPSEEALAGARAQLAHARVPFVEHVASSDDIVGAIMNAAQDHSCGIVAMGTRGLGPLAGQLLGSVAQGVLERAERAGITVVLAR